MLDTYNKSTSLVCLAQDFSTCSTQNRPSLTVTPKHFKELASSRGLSLIRHVDTFRDFRGRVDSQIKKENSDLEQLRVRRFDSSRSQAHSRSLFRMVSTFWVDLAES